MRGKCFPEKLHAFFLHFQFLSALWRAQPCAPAQRLVLSGCFSSERVLPGGVFFLTDERSVRPSALFPPVLPCVSAVLPAESPSSILPRGVTSSG